MLPQTLPISRLINVGVTLSPQAAQGQNLNALLILGISDVIDVVTRIRSYTTLAEVAADFGTSADEYLAAALWFEQAPQPTQLYIGRWAKTASAGQLFGGSLSATQQTIATWQAVTNGGFHITVDGGGAQSIVGLDFSGAANLNAVAVIIQAAITGATCVWNAVYSRFEITSDTTGASSTVSFLTTPASGTDISGMMLCTAASSGAYVANGIVAETALAAVELFDSSYGQAWFALVVLTASDSDHTAIAAYIEAANNYHFYGVTTEEAGVLNPADTSDVAYLLKTAGVNRTAVQYSSSNAFAVVSMLARILTTDYNGNNTVITLMYKQEPGITAENLNETQADSIAAKNCNVFAEYNDDTAIIQNGVCSSGQFIDTVIGALALAVTIQAAVYNLLYTSTTKIPQTNAGMHLITTAISEVLNQFVQNGWIAPGVWTEAGFGELKQNQLMPTGFYVFAPPVSSQSAAARATRISVPIQIAVKLAGAVQTVAVSIVVNS